MNRFDFRFLIAVMRCLPEFNIDEEELRKHPEIIECLGVNSGYPISYDEMKQLLGSVGSKGDKK